MLLIAFAEFERDMISERTSESAKYLAQQGYPRSGVQLGYDKVNELSVVNEEEAKLVNKIFALYLEYPSASKVATMLNELGYRTKQHISKDGKTISGNNFTTNNIKQIISNHEYLGKVKLNDVLYDGKHDAIVDETLFNNVQEQSKSYRRTDRFRTKERSIPLTLNEVLYCGFCGTHMTPSYGMKNGEKYYYYRCTKKGHDTAQACPVKFWSCSA